MRKSTLMQITSIREEDNMKTMKKAISVLLLVCMVSALCSAGAYATEAGSTTGTGGENNTAEFTISLDKDVFSTNDQVSAKAAFPDGKSAANYTITWSWGDETYTAKKGAADVAWQAGEIKNGQQISATATKATDSSTGGSNEETLKSNTVTAKIIPPVSSVEISCNNNNTLSCTAKAVDGADVSSNIKTYSWSSSNDKVTLATPEGATTTYSSTDTSTAQTANITVKVTDNFGTEVTSAQYSVTIPAAAVPVAGITVSSATENVAPGGTVQMSATVAPDNATNKTVSWSVSDGATVDSNGFVTVKADAAVNSTITVTAAAQDNSGKSGSATINVIAPERKIAAKLSPDANPLTVGNATNTKTLVAYYTDDASQNSISGVTWTQISQNPTAGNIATLNGSTVTAGDTPGAVTYKALLDGKDTGATVTVTVNAAKSNVNLNISQLNKPANVDGFTITAKGGVISIKADATDAASGAALYGTYKWFISNAPISEGIGLTDNKNGTATVSGKYNGSGSNAYTVGVTFTPTDTSKYDVKTAYCAVNVKFAHVIDVGNYQVWDGHSGMSFITNDSYYNFNYDVRIDGQSIANVNGYTITSSPDGRILVTLTPDCLKYIMTYYNGNGTHTISIGNKNAAAATGYFRTWGTASSFNGVKTGDDANLGLWAALLAVSAVGAGAAVVICKRRKANRG